MRTVTVLQCPVSENKGNSSLTLL